MEKLIELLLECKPQIHYLGKPKGVYDKKYGIGWYKREWDIGWWFSEELIISKKFWFIKRLVDNDKIDLRKLKNIYMSDYWSSDDIFLAYDKWEQWIIYIVDYYESLLMQLSISDNPIQDLVLYLK